MNVYQQDDGKSIPLILGELLSIHLPENCSTGYRWTLEALVPENILLLQRTFIESKMPPVLGAGGMRVWVFKAAGIGKTQINLKRWRPWEGEKSVKERFVLQVEVIREEMEK